MRPSIPSSDAASDLIGLLRRKVDFDLVFGEVAERWDDQTKKDFADALKVEVRTPQAMDAIVDIAILNDPELERRLVGDNISLATNQDLTDNRRIVSQYPPPGTPLEPPYLALIAVEYVDTTRGEQFVPGIIAQLQDFKGTKLPAAAIAKLQ